MQKLEDEMKVYVALGETPLPVPPQLPTPFPCSAPESQPPHLLIQLSVMRLKVSFSTGL